MSEKTVKVPGPDHPITIQRNPRRIIVRQGDKILADTVEALTLREASYPAVHYIPRKDVEMASLTRSETHSYCPYKGEASYFRITGGGERSIDAVWTYEDPHEAMADIRDYLAFYPDRVDSIEEHEA